MRSAGVVLAAGSSVRMDGIRDQLEVGFAAEDNTGAVAVGEPRAAAPAKPINAIGLLFSIIAERIRGWFRR